MDTHVHRLKQLKAAPSDVVLPQALRSFPLGVATVEQKNLKATSKALQTFRKEKRNSGEGDMLTGKYRP